jgi:hypothetical protein
MEKETTLETTVENVNDYYAVLNSFEKSLTKLAKYIAKNSWKLLPIGLERYYFMNGRYQKSPPNQSSNS